MILIKLFLVLSLSGGGVNTAIADEPADEPPSTSAPKICADTLKASAAAPTPGKTVLNPLFSDFTRAQEAVKEELTRIGAALDMSPPTLERLLEMVTNPEFTKYFDPKAAPIYFEIEPQKLSYDIVAAQLLEEFRKQESETLEDMSFRKRAKRYIHRSSAAFKRGVKYYFIIPVIAGFAMNLLKPITEPITARFGSIVFQGTERVQNLFESHRRQSEFMDHLPPELHARYYTIWRQTNQLIPLNERDGRSLQLEVVYLHAIYEMNLRNLIQNPPHTATRRPRWERSVRHYIERFRALPQEFPEVYRNVEFSQRLHRLGEEIIEEAEETLREPTP